VCLQAARANVEKNGIGKLVAIEDRDIFTLDLSRGPTIVSLYLLPSLNLRLLPQLQKLPAGARVLSVGHRLGEIPPDQKIWVEEEDFFVYLWRAETLRQATPADADRPATSSPHSAGPLHNKERWNWIDYALPWIGGVAAIVLLILLFGMARGAGRG